MLTQKEMANAGASRASILMKTGACVGGTIVGYMSQFVGRRRAIIISALCSAILIPAWILPEGERSLSASGFFMQFFVQGAWGVIPIHLNELSPPAFRSSFPGSYLIPYQSWRILTNVRRYHIPARKHDLLALRPDRQRNCRENYDHRSIW
jgi:hypothetical protein